MKKFGLLAIVLAGTMLLAACGEPKTKTIGGSENSGVTSVATTPIDNKNADTTKANGFSFSYKGNDVAVNDDIEDVLAKLGEPDSKFEAKSCAFDGMTMFYTYQGFEIDTYEKDGKNLVATIVITSDLAETKEGVTIGDAESKLESAYGSDCTKTDNTRVYTMGDCKLTFILKDGVIISIEYLSLTI